MDVFLFPLGLWAVIAWPCFFFRTIGLRIHYLLLLLFDHECCREGESLLTYWDLGAIVLF